MANTSELLNSSENMESFAFQQALRNTPLQNQDYQNILNQFNQCTCCARHQQNRPSLIGPKPYLPFRNTDTSSLCQCGCRNKSRILCKEIFGDHTPPEVDYEAEVDYEDMPHGDGFQQVNYEAEVNNDDMYDDMYDDVESEEEEETKE